MDLKKFFQDSGPYLTRYLVEANGLCGYAFHHAHASEEDKIFYRSKMVQWNIRYLVFARELKKFQDHFPGAFPLKGMSLIPRIYHDPSLREVTDVDIYSTHSLRDLREYLSDQGYSMQDEHWEGNSFKLNGTKLVDGVEVPLEIHQKLLWTEQEPWETISVGDSILLRPEDELVYLCGHLAYQHTMLSLHWLIDIGLLIENNPRWNGDRIEELLRQLPLRTSLSTVLWCLSVHLNLKIPDALKKFNLQHPKNLLIQKIINKSFLWHSLGNPLRYYPLKHLLKDSFTASLKYDQLWLLHKLRSLR